METAANHTDSDYLKVYREFFEEVVGKINPVDQLPVRVSPYNVTDTELVGQIVYLTLQYIKQPRWPQSLQGYIVRLVVEEVKAMCQEHPEDCGFNSDKKTYKPLKLMQAVTSKVNEIFNRYLDNSRLASLPPPGTAQAPLARTTTFKNQRRKLEDRHIEIYDLHTIFDVQDDSLASYYAVFDGHGGDDAAEYCAMHLHQYLLESTFYPTDPERALRDAFLTTDTRFIDKLKTRKVSGGTTAVCALLLRKKLYIAWVGDSSAIIARHGRPEVLVNPHKLSRNDEYERVRKMGGMLLHYQGTLRINGLLAVSRAIGDFRFKPYVTSEPDIRCVSLDGTEDFLILATDGFWDFVNEFEASELVYFTTHQYPDNPEYSARHLAELAKFSGSPDNITVTIVFLTSPKEIAAKASNSIDMAYVQRDHAMDIVKNDSMFKMLDEELVASRDQHEGPYDNEQERHLHHHLRHQSHNLHHRHHHNNQQQRHENGTKSDLDEAEFPHHDVQMRVEHGNEATDYNDLDFGPETDVDAVDDVDNMLANVSLNKKEQQEQEEQKQNVLLDPLDNVSRELCHEEKSTRVANNENEFQQDDDAPFLDDDDSPPSPANVNAKPLQHALLSEADNVADSEDSDDEWNYYRVRPNKEKDTLSDEVRESKDSNESYSTQQQQQPDKDNNIEIQSPQFEEDSKCESPKEEAQTELINTDISAECKEEIVDSAFVEESEKEKEEEEEKEVKEDEKQEEEEEEKLDLQEQHQQQQKKVEVELQEKEEEEEEQHPKEKEEEERKEEEETEFNKQEQQQKQQESEQQEYDEYANMDFQLNPNAAEFIPGSPSNRQMRMNLMHDSLVASSPLKPVTMDDITVPSQKEFEDEVCKRPKDIEETDSPKKDHNEGTDYTKFFADKQKGTVGVPVAGLDESEVSSTKAEFGDESAINFLGTTMDLQKTGISTMDESFGNSECDFFNRDNPMTMSFTPCDFKAAFEKGGETVDLNAVHDLDEEDLEDENLFEKEDRTSLKSPVLCSSDSMMATEMDDDAKQDSNSLPDGQSCDDILQASSMTTCRIGAEDNMFLESGDVDEQQQIKFLQTNFKRQSSPISFEQLTESTNLLQQQEHLSSTENLDETADIEKKQKEEHDKKEEEQQHEGTQKELEHHLENEKDVSEKIEDIETTGVVEPEIEAEMSQEGSFRDQDLLSPKIHETTKSVSSVEDTPKSVSPIPDETAERLEEAKEKLISDEPLEQPESSHPIVEDTTLTSPVEEKLIISSTEEEKETSLTSNLHTNAPEFCPHRSSFDPYTADESATKAPFVEAPIMQNPLDIMAQFKSTAASPSIFVPTEKQEHIDADEPMTESLLDISEPAVDVSVKDDVEETKTEMSLPPEVGVEEVVEKVSQDIEETPSKQIDNSDVVVTEVAEVKEEMVQQIQEVVNAVPPVQEITSLEEQLSVEKVELKEDLRSESPMVEEQAVKEVAQPEEKKVADEVLPVKEEEPEQQTVMQERAEEQINEKLETASSIESPETVEKITEPMVQPEVKVVEPPVLQEKTVDPTVPEEKIVETVPEKTVQPTESQKLEEKLAESSVLEKTSSAPATTAAVATATAVAAAAAAGTATAAATSATTTKAKAKPTTKSGKPTSATSKTTPKSTPTSPSKTLTSTTRPTLSSAATKKMSSTSTATRPKQLDTAPKTTSTFNAAKPSTTKVATSTTVTSKVSSSTRTATSRPTTATTKTSKPPSGTSTTEKKSTLNGDVKSLKSTATTNVKSAKSATSTVSSTTKTAAASKTSSSASRTAMNTGTTLSTAKSRPSSATTAARSPHKPSTAGSTSGTITSTTKLKSTTTASTIGASTNNHVTMKAARTSAASKTSSVAIDKQVKETANKQISMARNATSATSKSTRTSASATTISTTSATTKRLSNVSKSATNTAALSPARKTAVSKVMANLKSSPNAAKSKIVQNGTIDNTEHSKNNSIVEKIVAEEDVPKKDLSPVVASTDNQLIVSAD